jgi:selenocysteine lyase/cysteine desulfurase
LLGCTTDEIALVENATRGWDMAFYSLRFKAGDRILTSDA